MTGTNGPQTGCWRIGNILVPQGRNTSQEQSNADNADSLLPELRQEHRT